MISKREDAQQRQSPYPAWISMARYFMMGIRIFYSNAPGACISACTYRAIDFVDTPAGKKAAVNPILCKGDGLCNAKCPTNAIVLEHFTDEALLSQIDAAIDDREGGESHERQL